MAKVLIEIDRGNGWQVRQEGEADMTAAMIAQLLPEYCTQYPHRAFLDGVLVASATPGRKVKVVQPKIREVTRRDASPSAGLDQEWVEYQVVKGRIILSRHGLRSAAETALAATQTEAIIPI